MKNKGCPLRRGELAIDAEIPKICRDQCEVRWSKSIDAQNLDGPYYHYGNDPEGCSGEVEHSHDSLRSIDESSTRVYSIIDRCTKHDVELGEQGYIFQCENNIN